LTQSLEDWFQVTFDDTMISLDAQPSDVEGWSAQILWNDIIRVCFKPGDYISTDEIYIFTNQRPDSYLIPVEASGGFEVWMEIIRRGLFDADLAIKAASTIEEVLCWPKEIQLE